MATEIKAIKCPQCGSPQKTEIKPGSFRCSSCQTDYFLDDDRLTIQHNHTFHLPAAPPPAARLSPLVRGVLAALAVGVAGAALRLVPGGTAVSDGGASDLSSASGSQYYGRIEKTVPLAGSEGQPVMLVVASQSYNQEGDKAKNGPYVTFYDPLKHKEIDTERLDVPAVSAVDVEARTFSDGRQYVIVNKTTLFVVDNAALKLVEAGKQWFERQPVLRAGLASMEFVPQSNGDGLALLTNDGKSLFYYPLVNRIYTETELDAADDGFANLLPGATLKTSYTFTNPTSSCKGTPVKLLQIKFKDNGGGPKRLCENVMCSQVSTGTDPNTGATAYRNEDISGPEYYRVTSYRDFTPGRLYFKPSFLYADAQSVLIASRATPAPEAPLNLQCLDPATGQVRWTAPLAKLGDPYVLELVACKGGFLGSSSYGTAGFVVSTDGKVISRFDLK
ncbi:hypothetical protein GCM10022409_44380 [Hymenobacter glaciei]|uniref:C2H2-type domain-containing protein n=1 Tax=Hymenobacter glaciei TaxID=877209 RepID=A0ABP7UTZ0_9BACT